MKILLMGDISEEEEVSEVKNSDSDFEMGDSDASEEDSGSDWEADEYGSRKRHSRNRRSDSRFINDDSESEESIDLEKQRAVVVAVGEEGNGNDSVAIVMNQILMRRVNIHIERKVNEDKEIVQMMMMTTGMIGQKRRGLKEVEV